MSAERRLEEIFMEASMTPKKDEYMRGYHDGFKDASKGSDRSKISRADAEIIRDIMSELFHAMKLDHTVTAPSPTQQWKRTQR